MANNQKKDDLLSIGEAAAIFKVNRETLRRWDKSGKLRSVRVGRRNKVGDRKYRKIDILDFTAKRIEEIKSKK
jgi:excisionase family DNA binding protein